MVKRFAKSHCKPCRKNLSKASQNKCAMLCYVHPGSYLAANPVMKHLVVQPPQRAVPDLCRGLAIFCQLLRARIGDPPCTHGVDDHPSEHRCDKQLLYPIIVHARLGRVSISICRPVRRYSAVRGVPRRSVWSLLLRGGRCTI